VTEIFEQVIHRAVARHAVQRPDAVAIIAAGQNTSYAALNAAADGYAAELTGLGVRAGSVVPLLLPRSAQLIALQLAVLKCGAAYAGVDLRWPAERIAAILELLAPPLVVVSSRDAHLAGTVGTYTPPREGLAEAAARVGVGFHPHSTDAADPATVFFTSGTTGRPKVVVSPHQAITRLFQPGGLAGFGPMHATPQAAPVPWDMYAFEVWGQLVSGGTTVLVGDDHLMPRTLRELVTASGVDTLWLTSSLFNLFVDEDIDCFTGLGQVLTGGEKLSSAHVRAFLARHPGIQLHNGYGPAESAMLTTTRLLRPADCDLPIGVPVGTAVAGTTVLVLDAAGRLCPPGEPGEICIAGQGLACGYYADPELTAAKFPTVRVDGRPMRIYRTGDIGVADETGVLHFHGRADRQVKISGHRVELDEIEAAARRLAGVRDCVTVPVLASAGEVIRIALFYVADTDLPAAGGDLLNVRSQLLRKLPRYLVPDIVQHSDRFPVTANGKVDARALLRSSRRTRPAGRSDGAAQAEP
jgi:amino acid adenylation domain-containing protein